MHALLVLRRSTGLSDVGLGWSDGSPSVVDVGVGGGRGVTNEQANLSLSQSPQPFSAF